MATENKRVASYLPPALHNLLKEFQEQHGLGESKAIIEILSDFFGVSQKVAHPNSLDLVKRIEAIEEKLEAHLAAHSNESPQPSSSTELPEASADQKPEVISQLGLGVEQSGLDSPPARPDGQRWLSTSQAFERAKDRGCKRNKNGFKGWSQREPSKCLEKYQLRRIENVTGQKRSSVAPGYEDMDWEDQVDF